MNWEQFQAILWVRWRLTKNQISRGGQLNAVLSVIIYTMMAVGGVATGVGGLIGGYYLGAKAAPQVLLVVWDFLVFFFLVFWGTGLMLEIQRSESLDLARLLHLPVTLTQVFVFNFVASHLTPSIVVIVPAMVGLCVGMTVGGGVGLAPMLPLALGFMFMTTAWTYCLRGWLAALMINKRRRRTIILFATVFFVLIVQIPNLLNTPLFRHRLAAATQSGQQAAHGPNPGEFLPEAVVRWHAFLPPAWPGLGALDLKRGQIGFPAAAALTMWLAGVLGIWRAYELTLRFYRGAGGGESARPAPVRQQRARRGRMLVERTLPGLPEDTAALTLATVRSLARAPELKMAFIAPAVITIVMSSLLLGHDKSGLGPISAPLASTGAVMLAVFAMAPIMSNAFGIDRSAFRGLMLLPTARDQILLAKNLACLPFNFSIATLVMFGVRFVVHMPWLIFLAGLVQAITAFLLFALMGNATSILAPFRLNPGTLQAKKPKATVMLAGLVAMFLTPIVSLPILIPAGLQILCSYMGWVPWLPVDLIVALAVLAGAAALYRALLPAQGRLLQRREQRILREVTEETE